MDTRTALLLGLLVVGPAAAQWNNAMTGRSFNNPTSALIDTMIMHSMQRKSLERSFAGRRTAVPEKGAGAGHGAFPTQFEPAGSRLMVEPFVAALAEDPETRAGLRQVFEAVFAAFEPQAAAAGAANDVAAAIAFHLQAQYTVARDGVEIGDEASDALLAQCREAFATPELRAASDADKQRLYETFVMLAGLTAAGYQQAVEGGDAAARQAMVAQGAEGLKTMLRVDPGRVRMGAGGLSIDPEPPTPVPAQAEPGRTSSSSSSAAAGPAAPASLVADVALGTGPATWGDYEYAVPPGMAATAYPDGLGLKAAGAPGEGDVTITLLPLRPAKGALDEAALAIAREFFQGRFASFRGRDGGDRPLDFQLRGVTRQGFEYVELPALGPVGPDGAQAPGSVRVLLVRVGGQVAPVVGFDGTGRRGLDEPGYRWIRLFHSLGFPGAKAADEDPYAAGLVGKWGSGGSTGSSFDEFRADGSYVLGVGVTTKGSLGPDMERHTSKAWGGVGTWRLQGNRLRRACEGGGPPRTAWIRITAEPNSAVPGGWLRHLWCFEQGADGTAFEVGLVPQ